MPETPGGGRGSYRWEYSGVGLKEGTSMSFFCCKVLNVIPCFNYPPSRRGVVNRPGAIGVKVSVSFF